MKTEQILIILTFCIIDEVLPLLKNNKNIPKWKKQVRKREKNEIEKPLKQIFLLRLLLFSRSSLVTLDFNWRILAFCYD